MLPNSYRSLWSFLLVMCLCYIIPSQASAQCSAIIDLNTWNQEGPAANGTWTVNGAGTSVTQSINGLPTFFVSPEEFINVRMTGTISSSGGDDDFIGFVFGYQNPIGGAGPNYPMETMLFDWKRGTQGAAQEGRYLVQMDTNFNLANNASVTNFFWGKQSTPNHNVLGAVTGANTGWNQNVNYNFELTYLADRVTIVINNDTFFDVTGCFQSGRFGFYNYSQNPVVYSNFAYQLLPDFAMASNDVCLTDSARFFYFIDTCSSQLVTNTEIASWQWDFGDGNIDSVANPVHLYGATGTYNVQLIITDSLGCIDSLTQPVTVSAVPAPPVAGSNSPICEGSNINLTGTAPPGLNYNWTGPAAFTSNQQNPSVAAATPANGGDYILTVDNGNCSSFPDTTNVVVFPTPAAPAVSSNSPVCEDSALVFNMTTVPGATYTWTGPNGFTSSQASPTIANPSTLASGNYDVFATINGCAGPVTTLNVTINATPVVDIAGDSVICIGDATTLTANGASTYVWNTSATTASVNVAPNATTRFYVTGTSAAGCPSRLDSIDVVVNPLPTVFLGNDTTVCDQLTLDAGAGQLAYAWNTGATTQTLNVTTTGTYIVTVLSPDSCVAADTIQVTVNTTPTVSILADSTICPGDVTTLTAQGATSYIWSTTATTPAITVGPPANTVYSVTGTTNGCTSAPASINVIVGAPANVNLGPNFAVCDQTTLNAGAGFMNYLWNTGATTQTLNVNTTGTYGVVVMNADSCIDSDSVFVTVNITPTVSIVGDTAICPGESTTLTASGGTTYLWTTQGFTTPSITVTPPFNTLYAVQTTSNGCTSAPDSVTVTVGAAASVNLGTGGPVCDGTTLDAGPGFLSYIWNTSATTQTINVGTSGIYGVVVMNSDSCIASDSVNITVNATQLVDAGNDTTICASDAATFNAAPGGFSSYQWNNGDQTQSTTVSAAGPYIVNTVDVNGCPDADTVQLSVFPVLSGDIGPDSTICDGTTITLDASGFGGVTYAWTPGGQTTSSIQVNSPGTYGVTIDDGNGCIYTDQRVIFVDVPPTLSVSVSDDTVCSGTAVQFTAAPGGLQNYIFEVNGSAQQGNNNPVYGNAGLANGDVIQVTGITAAGCPTNLVVANPVEILPIPAGNLSVADVCDGETSVLDLAGLTPGVAVTWNGTGGLGGNGSPLNYVYPGPGTFSISAVLDNGFCQSTVTGSAFVRELPPTPFVPDAFACEGADIELNAQGNGLLEWYDAPTGGNLVATGPFYILPNVAPGSDTLYIQSFSNNCASPRHEFTVDVGVTPTAEFISNPDTTGDLNIPTAFVEFVNLSSNADNYFWNFGDGQFSSEFSPTHFYNQEGFYTVTLISSTNVNCADTFSLGLYRVTNVQQVLIPNAFTPNNDGLNDVLEIVLYGVESYQIEIFDRWGKFIFANASATDFWDGTINGQPVQEGVYVYKLRFPNPDGTFSDQSGTVTIYR